MTPIYKVSDVFVETVDESGKAVFLYREKPLTRQPTAVLKELLNIRPGATDNPDLMSRVMNVINAEFDLRAALSDQTGLIFLKAAIISEIQSGSIACVSSDACIQSLEEWTRNWDVSYDGGDYQCRPSNDPTVTLYLTALAPAGKVPAAKLCLWDRQTNDTLVLVEGSADYVIRQITELGVPALKTIYRNSVGLPPTSPVLSR